MTMVTKLKGFLSKIKPLHIIVIILAAALLFSFYQYYKAQNELKNFKTNPEQAASKEIEKLVEEIGKIIDLPKDETPLFRNVVDPQKLKDEPFFANAQV